MQGDSRIRKLRWMCRRGMKELDVLLEAFLERQDAALRNGEWLQLESFLGEEDDRIWDWIQLTQTPESREYQSLVHALRDRS